MSEVSSTTAAIVTQMDDPTRTVQVQVLPPQNASGTDANGTIVHTVTPSIQNTSSSLISTAPGQSITPEVSAQITQITGLRLPADQQQKLLLAAQLQQLSKSTVGGSIPNASFVIQPAFPAGNIAVVSSTPDTQSTKV